MFKGAVNDRRAGVNRPILTIMAVLALACCVTLPALAAPASEPWPRWQAHDAESNATIDYRAFDAFLGKYVVVHAHGPNGVRYGAVTSADRQRLDQFIRRLEKLRIDDYNRRVQRAYWINLYNAKTLDLVLRHYPVDSIKNIGGGFFSSGPWDETLLKVEGQELSLNDIEHRILRPIWPDGLTHYGVNCASISCPSLLKTAYTGANVAQKLRDNAHAYINSPQGVSIDGTHVVVSRIYAWYIADFGGDQAGVISQLRRYAAPQLSARLDMLHHINDYRYDWALNDEKQIDKR